MENFAGSHLTILILYSLLVEFVEANLAEEKEELLNRTKRSLFSKQSWDLITAECSEKNLFECDDYCDSTGTSSYLVATFFFLPFFLLLWIVLFGFLTYLDRYGKKAPLTVIKKPKKKKSTFHQYDYDVDSSITKTIDENTVKKEEPKKPRTPVPAEKSASFAVSKPDETDDEKMLDRMIEQGVEIVLGEDKTQEKLIRQQFLEKYNFDLNIPANRKKAWLYLKRLKAIDEAAKKNGKNNKKKKNLDKGLKDFKRKGSVFIPRDVQLTQQCTDAPDNKLNKVYFDEKDNEVYSIGTDVDDIELDQDSSIGSSALSSRASMVRASASKASTTRKTPKKS